MRNLIGPSWLLLSVVFFGCAEVHSERTDKRVDIINDTQTPICISTIINSMSIFYDGHEYARGVASEDESIIPSGGKLSILIRAAEFSSSSPMCHINNKTPALLSEDLKDNGSCLIFIDSIHASTVSKSFLFSDNSVIKLALCDIRQLRPLQYLTLDELKKLREYRATEADSHPRANQ